MTRPPGRGDALDDELGGDAASRRSPRSFQAETSGRAARVVGDRGARRGEREPRPEHSRQRATGHAVGAPQRAQSGAVEPRQRRAAGARRAAPRRAAADAALREQEVEEKQHVTTLRGEAARLCVRLCAKLAHAEAYVSRPADRALAQPVVRLEQLLRVADVEPVARRSGSRRRARAVQPRDQVPGWSGGLPSPR